MNISSFADVQRAVSADAAANTEIGAGKIGAGVEIGSVGSQANQVGIDISHGKDAIGGYLGKASTSAKWIEGNWPQS